MKQTMKRDLGKKLKVMQIAPIALPISPDLKYGGIERVLLNLDNGLIDAGIDSSMAAVGVSKIRGKLLPTLKKDLFGNSKDLSERKKMYKEHTSKVLDYLVSENPDVMHDHEAGFILNSGIVVKKFGKPFVSTFHTSNIDQKMIDKWKDVSPENYESVMFVSISNSQKKLIENNIGIPISKVIYHGLDLSAFPYTNDKKDFLLSVGKIAPEKGQDIAIDVAKKTKKSLIIAGPVQEFVKENLDFYNSNIKPFIDYDLSNNSKSLKEIINLTEKEKGKIFYVGPINDFQRNFLNKYAKSFLMPLRWSEGFGLVMIEAMACGTPVIAFNRGSIPEVVEHGKSGYIVEDVEEMINYLGKVDRIKNLDCREYVKEKFNLRKQVNEYINIYEKAIKNYF